MKLGPISKVVGVMVLGLSVLGAIRLIDTVPAHRLAALMGITLDAPGTTVIPTVTPPPVLPDVTGSQSLSVSTVAIQVFSASHLVRSGSGTAVSSDGLIVTSSAVVPVSSGPAAVYQVATPSGALLRAHVVWRAPSGLVLLKVDATDLVPVTFEHAGTLEAGQEMMLIGALLRLSRYVPVLVPATIPYVFDEHTIAISYDRSLSTLLAGARLVDALGRSQGIFLWSTPAVRVLPAQAVVDAIEEYLVQEKK